MFLIKSLKAIAVMDPVESLEKIRSNLIKWLNRSLTSLPKGLTWFVAAVIIDFLCVQSYK